VVGVSLTVAFLAAWALLFAGPLSGLQQARSQDRLYAGFRHELARETAPTGGVIGVGTAVAVLTAPQAGLHDEVVVEGTSARELEEGPGHLRDTPLPGQQGTAVLFGRSLSFGGPFSGIGRLRSGDRIAVVTQQGRFTYVVTGVRHLGDPVPAAPASGEGRLVLVSTASSGWRGGWAPSQEVLVDARLDGAAVATSAAPPAAISAAEAPMARDTSLLPLVVLGLQGLLFAALGIAWLDARGSRRRAWALGVPVLVAVLWFLSQSAAALVPNLL
jgi:sortase A